MGILISAQQISKSYGARLLFRDLSFSISEGERVGLIGPNGAGKSTLLRLFSGRSAPDVGTISCRRGLRVGFLEQVPTFSEAATVESVVQESNRDPHDWEFEASLQEWLSKLSLDGSQGIHPHTPVAELSGGWKKRVALARELAKHPDLLLLDEPTNHLDIESILWLEALLAKSSFACLCITHDRLFLQRVSNRILELDPRLPEGLLSVAGDYADYLDIKEELLAAQQKRERVLKNTLRRETEWLRRGPKARGTKQQARIERAGELAEELDDLSGRNRTREVGLDFAVEESRPKKLIEAQGISKSLGGKLLFSKLDLLVTPKSRIGLLGSNGCGKSTLLRILLGDEAPDTGSIHQADSLRVAYFEQNRESLNPKISLLKTLCPTGDHVDYRGKPLHIRGYLDRFLFSPAQMELPVGRLSGGEQSRLLIARLMLKPANVLVLDEPTNDLDIATLDVLEDCLKDFTGAVLLVTHDRFFLNEIAAQILAFGPKGTREEGHITAFASLDQWEAWHADLEALPSFRESAEKSDQSSPPVKKKKLGYMEQREFDGLEAKIHEAEARLSGLRAESELPENSSNSSRLLELSQQIMALEAEIEGLYHRWAELENRSNTSML
jgi:ATP-binding cassette subfamily F protein uup